MDVKAKFTEFRDKVVARKRTRSDMILSFCCLILSLAILLCSVTYSWIRRNWSSTVQESQLKIESSGSLAFQLDSSEYTTAISLLTQIGSPNFTLKPVSSLTGKTEDFFYLNKDTSSPTYAHVPISATGTSTDRMNIGKQYGYIEFSFKILGETVTATPQSVSTIKFVYFNTNSFFQAFDDTNQYDLQAAQAVRVSITSKNASNQEQTIVFMNRQAGVDTLVHTGINNAKNGNAWVADGASYWTSEGLDPASTITVNGTTPTQTNGQPYPITCSTTDVHELSEYFGGIQTDTATGKRYVTPTECLCRFSSSDYQDITVRVWIEGTSGACTEDIAGNKISLLLSFGAVNCQYDATSGHYYVVEHTAETDTP